MRADRLLAMILLLHARGHSTAEQLASELAVSERTIYRDIDALSIAGVPIYTQSGPNGGVFLDESYRLPLDAIAPNEVQALLLAADSAPLTELGLSKAAEGLLLRLLAALPTQQQHQVQQARHRFYIDPVGWFQVVEPSPFWADVQQAVWEDWRISIRYQSVEKTIQEHTVDAYGLVSKANKWYLVGRKASGEWRNYRLQRLLGLTILPQHFHRDINFDLADYWEATCREFEAGSVSRFPPYDTRLKVHQAAFWYFPAYMEEMYATVVEPNEQGWREITARFPGFEEARTRVMGLGAGVRVLEPQELQQAVFDHARTILSLADE